MFVATDATAAQTARGAWRQISPSTCSERWWQEIDVAKPVNGHALKVLAFHSGRRGAGNPGVLQTFGVFGADADGPRDVFSVFGNTLRSLKRTCKDG